MTALRLYLAIAMLRTARRLHDAAGQIICGVEYRRLSVHHAELVVLALLVGTAVAGVWIGTYIGATTR